MSTFATFDDLKLFYEGTIPDSDRPRLEALIRRASARLLRIVPSVDFRVLSGELDSDLPAGLVIEAVLRVYRNPEGVTQEQIGPFSKQFAARGVNSEILFDPIEVHELLDPVPTLPAPSIRLGLPTLSEIRTEVAGYTDDTTDPTVSVPVL